MRKIRVLRVITWLPVGGIERKIVDVLPRLDRSRFEVSLACIRERGPLAGELEASGIPVHLIPFKTRWDPAALARLAGLMRREKIDIVHSHMYRSNVPATVAAKLAGVPSVWSQVHNVNTWETGRQLALDRMLCRWRTGMLAVSEEVRRDVMEKLQLLPERVRVIHNGVDLGRYGTGAGREELRNEAGVAEDESVLLIAARMVSQKHPETLLDLAFELQRIHPKRASLHFWFAGDGPLLESLEARAASAPLPGRIRFWGRRDDVNRLMAASDFFVMPSEKEGFSNALLEAMASGLAIVATHVGGNAEAIRDGRDGLIIPPGDSSAFGAAVRRLLDETDLRRALAASARERARDFSLETMVRNVEALYEGSMMRPTAE